MNRNAAAIIQLFHNENGYISGAYLSSILGISRTAVWKHISTLRKDGYTIDAVPSRGYRLITRSERLDPHIIKSGLRTTVIGNTIEFRKNTASTNSDAFNLAEGGAPAGTVVLADAQSGGKGRRGRTWTSPPGVNIYCSVVLRPDIMPFAAPQLTFLSAVAVARAIEQTTTLKPQIKWPNDLLISGKKVAGLLNEMSAETDGINFVILGIGVNLNMTPEMLSTDFRHPATSLFIESGNSVDRSAFTAIMLTELDRLYADFLCKGFQPVREEWQRRCNANGRTVVVSDGGSDELSGTFEGIDTDGTLLLRSSDNILHRVSCGDVRVI